MGVGGGSGRTEERSIPTYSRYFRVFPCFSGFFQVFPGISRVFRVFPGTWKTNRNLFWGRGGGVWGSWERCFPGYSGSLQVFPGSFQVFPGSLQGFPGFSGFTPGYSGFFQVHSRVFRCFPGLSMPSLAHKRSSWPENQPKCHAPRPIWGDWDCYFPGNSNPLHAFPCFSRLTPVFSR